MQSVAQAVLLSWSVPPAATFALVVTGVVYLRGWVLMRHAGVPFIPPWRAVSFLLGLLSLWIALASPFDTFSSLVLTAHMLQHMMLMMLAPPLILLGAPLVPLVRGLPVFAAREFAGPFVNWRVATRTGNALTQPAMALLLMGVVMFAWHTPRLYELALASSSWHEFEHACFFLVALVFWWPVIQPWPSRATRPRWVVIPYLLIGDVQNTALSAILIFADRVLYPSYATVPRLFGLSAAHDQAAAGAIMWVVGSLAFLIPAVIVAMECLQSKRQPAEVRAVPKQETFFLDRIAALCRRILPAGLLRRRMSSRSIEALSFVLLFAVSGLCLAYVVSASSGNDDNQVLRLHEQSGAFVASVFAPPGNLEAGPTAFSVLIQDRNSQEVVQDATVDLRAKSAGDSQAATVRASTEDSENKLLQSASLNLAAEGEWTLHIAVGRGAEQANFSVPIRVVKPDAGISWPWPYLVLLAFSAVLLISYARRHRARGWFPSRPVAKERSAANYS